MCCVTVTYSFIDKFLRKFCEHIMSIYHIIETNSNESNIFHLRESIMDLTSQIMNNSRNNTFNIYIMKIKFMF